MYETRDDSFVRPQEVLNHFRRNIEREALQKMYSAFEKAWSTPIVIGCPLDFAVNVEFERVLPSDIVDKICNELKDHGWVNYRLALEDGQHKLLVKLDPDEAKKYARA